MHSGIAAHVRYYVELWQHTRMGVDRRLQARMVERQLTYNVLTKEYKVAPLKGEHARAAPHQGPARGPARDLRAAGGTAGPGAPRSTRRSSTTCGCAPTSSLGGVNSWFARMTGEAEETPWVQSTCSPRCGASDAALPRPRAVDEQEQRKRNLLIITGILLLLVVATVFEVGIRAPEIPFASNLIVFALFNLNLIVFLLLLVLLFRNLVKLSFERRHKVIGAALQGQARPDLPGARRWPRAS